MLHGCRSFRCYHQWSRQHRRRPWRKGYGSTLFLLSHQNLAAARHPSFSPTHSYHRRTLSFTTKAPSSAWISQRRYHCCRIHLTNHFLAPALDPPTYPLDPALGLDDHLDLLLQRCSTLLQAQQVHALAITSSAHTRSAFLSARLVSVYSRFGLLDRARAVFCEFPPPRRTTLLWNSILRAYHVHGWAREVLSLYSDMKSGGLSQVHQCPDGLTFPLVVRACSSVVDKENIVFCRAIHAHVVTAGYHWHLHVANELVYMYGAAGLTYCAHVLFDRMRHRTVASYNMLMSGFACAGDSEAAVGLFQQMEMQGPKPNDVTWTSLLSAHAQSDERRGEVLRLFSSMRSRDPKVIVTAEAVAMVLSVVADSADTASAHGRGFHCFTLRSGFEGYFFVKNSLVSLYGKLRCVREAEAIFSETTLKTLVSWNALLSCYAEVGLYHEAYGVFSRLEKGELGFRPNAVSWTTMIGAFHSFGLAEQSLKLFRRMQEETRVYPDPVTVNTILSACAEHASLQYGKQLHGYLIRGTRDGRTLVGNGLLKMYCRCGNLGYARRVFEGMDARDVISWNTIISGYGTDGLCSDALVTFDDMLATSDIKPDSVTFLAVLSACSHAGHVSKGCQLFDFMINEHNLSPTVEHYSCMVDLLGRAGLLKEAAEFIEKMPLEPNVCTWGALLNSCHIHRDPDLAERIASKANIQLNSENSLLSPGTYMLLSNMYASSGRWEDSAKVRAMSRENGLRKLPGQSWIEVKNNVHVFSAGDEVPLDMIEYCHRFFVGEPDLLLDEDIDGKDGQVLES